MNFYSAFKYLAFKFDAELVHDLTINLLSSQPRLADLFSPVEQHQSLTLVKNDLSWSHPVGLAAGFDKNAKCIPFFEQLGFGALEVGTITKEPQAGNPKPRVHRHPKIDSVRNAMGFPNAGADAIYQNITNAGDHKICLGSNIGKNKETTEANTPEEYAYLYEKFAPVSDYLVINISSPNTPGLRAFQSKDKLVPIIEAVVAKRVHHPKPLFIKISPDMEQADIKLLCELSKQYQLSGVIATNTTINHDFGAGGLSGKYIRPYARKTRALVCEYLREDPSQTIIGVGGIDSYLDIKEFWQQGGSFVQVYTSFIYQGPALLKNMTHAMMADIKKHDCDNINQLIEIYKNHEHL